MKLSDNYTAYLKSSFSKDSDKIKNGKNESDEYMENYKVLAEEFIEYFQH